MTTRGDLLREVMAETNISQSTLSRISGVKQPSISQFVSGRTDLSDEMLERLLSCMGYSLEVVRRPVKVTLTRSEGRSWRLHLQLSQHLSSESLQGWRPVICSNLQRLRSRVQGEPHLSNLDRWSDLVEDGDLGGLRRVMTSLDTESIGMREVSPLGGLLPQEERLRQMASVGS